MNKRFGFAAFALGLAAVGWVAWGYLGVNPLALTMTLLIAAFYTMGGLELRRFHQATASLDTALAALPGQLPNLDDWLATLHPSLRNPVRLRIEGERVALPGPAMTPYLVGLLVLLGMLGTFLGMVVTLNGAVMALQSTTDLPAMRAALAAPVRGLGLAFGTSVAGVAASAMLGLVSALCRRERLLAAQALESRTASTLRVFSRAHQQQATLDALQQQSRALPDLVATVQTLTAQLARQGDDLNQRLLAGQDRFHQHAQTAYADLALSVDRSLQHSLSEGARAAGAALQPAVEATMAGITRETALFQTRLADTVQQQLDGLADRFDHTVTAVAETAGRQLDTVAERFGASANGMADHWREALDRQQRGSETLAAGLQQSLAAQGQTFGAQSASLLHSLEDAHAQRQAETAAGDQQRLVAWTGSLQGVVDSLQREWQQAGEQQLARQQQICQTLERTATGIQTHAEARARDTLAEMSRLIATASEAPRAAAELVGQLRDKLSDSMVRDNAMLEERSRIMATLGTLLDAVNQAATDQRAAIDGLVQSSAAMLQQTGARFDERIAAESSKLAAAAADATGSAIEVASLGEAFGAAVQLFGDSSEALVSQLQRIEAALGKSSARSDEQLAYYVAQAREIVDLSISSQRQIVDDLQQLAIRPAPPAGKPAVAGAVA